MNPKTLGRISALLGLALLLNACDRPPVGTIQRGVRGNGQVLVYNPRVYEAKFEELQIPEAPPPADTDGPKAKDAFENVQVLGDLSVTQLTRVMVSMASWVTGGEGCNYCHNMDKPGSDEKYPKRVARRMLQMVRYINSHWTQHVGKTGVTCFTCHRGNPVPANEWFENPMSVPSASPDKTFNGWHVAQNSTTVSIGTTALPLDPFSLFLKNDGNIRVQATQALPQGGPGASIQETEATYAMMMVISKSLGVNCDYCHNTRALANWQQSSPPRATAWYGIRMVRSLNNNFLDYVGKLLPPERLGPTGDGPKVYCATCHTGVFKPLYGISMLKDYPELAGDPAQMDDYLQPKPWHIPPTEPATPAPAASN
jgi:photosynthetic reaction center cytochrome c subunit